MELVVRVTTAEAAVSAAQNGADDILLAPSIPVESLGEFFPYARACGITVTLDCTRVCGDAELNRRALHISRLYALGLDSVLAGGAGLLRAAESAAPDCKLIWGAPCHNLDDILFARSLKCVRAVLSPYLTSHEIHALASASELPLAMWALCPLCPGGDPNLCLLSKSQSPYECSYTCKTTPYGFSGAADRVLLKTRDLCLLGHLREIPDMTVMISPPDPSPESVGLFTRIAREAADGKAIDERLIRQTFAALGMEAPTDAPYTAVGDIYSRDDSQAVRNERFWENGRQTDNTANTARARVPVRFFALVADGAPSRLAVDDYKGHTLYVEGTEAVRDRDNPTAEDELNALWLEAGGIFTCKEARTKIDPGLRLALPDAAALREKALQKLLEARTALPQRQKGRFVPDDPLLPRAEKPLLTIKVLKMSQVTPELLRIPPERLYIPLDEASGEPDKAENLVHSETVPVAVLPRIITESGRAEVNARLKQLHNIGFREALVWSPGQAVMAVRQGFTPRADWSAPSTQTLKAARAAGAVSCTLAPWLSLDEILKLNHVVDTEMIVYGRLPLLLARQCLIKRKSDMCACDNKCDLSDGHGGLLPLVRDAAHCTMVYHAQKLWMAPYRKQWRHIGLWAARLDFTTENARECVQVADAFAGRGDYEPHAVTTGFYLPEEVKKRKWF